MGQGPLWISHRGYAKAAPENTMGAFQAAYRAGFRALETDLRTTSDGHIVLCHDPDLLRTMERHDLVANLTRRKLEALRFKNGEGLLFLDQFLEAFPDCRWTFDIKPEGAERTVRAVIELFTRLGWKHKVLTQARFLFWRRDQEQLLRRYWSDVSCYPQERDCWRAAISVLLHLPFLGGIQRGLTYPLPPRFKAVDLFRGELVNAYHERGARTIAFLPTTMEEARKAVAAGFDEIITNDLPIGE